MQRIYLVLVVMFGASLMAVPARAVDIVITYLERVVPAPPTLSNLDPVPEDLGRRGAELGVKDVSTTAKFLGHTYVLETVIVGESDDMAAAAAEALARSPYVVANAPMDDLLALADLAANSGALVFNAGDPSNILRADACRANLLHTLPSRAMLADALAQFAVKKRWTDWAMIAGPRDGDKAYATALSDAARKFGIRIGAIKDWTFDTDLRRSAAQEIPLFTQDFPDHDLLIVADEANDFARYVQFNGWLPRPLGGSWGIVPTAWTASVEQHGAAQLQSRFMDLAGRSMQSKDYAAFLAVSAIGEAVTRTKSGDPADLRAYLLSDDFELGGFKGRPLSFRDWNGQLRQPIPLAHPGAVVALAPLEGFLHQFNELDTLGDDRPTSTCTAFSE